MKNSRSSAKLSQKLLEVSNTTNRVVPSLDWNEMRAFILGKRFFVSLVFCGDTLSSRLNKKYRGRDKPANVLTFALDPTQAEIYLNLRLATLEAHRFGRSPKAHIAALAIHGLAHAKGMDHGKEMDALEARAHKRFGITSSTR